MSTARKGRDSEWVIRNFLESYGYNVLRARGSKGPADLMAINEWEVLVLAVRKERWPSPADRKRLMGLERNPVVRAMVARTRHGEPQFAIPLHGRSPVWTPFDEIAHPRRER